jgi:hypothetical protein
MGRKAVSIFIAAFGFSLVAACGSDDEKDSTAKNVCEKACDKIEECPGQQCTLNLDNCSGSTEQTAQCVLATPCDQLASCI